MTLPAAIIFTLSYNIKNTLKSQIFMKIIFTNSYEMRENDYMVTLYIKMMNLLMNYKVKYAIICCIEFIRKIYTQERYAYG